MTIVPYRKGEAKAFGAEASEFINDEEYQRASWFKLLLHPESIQPSNAGKGTVELALLPPGVTLGKIYADFLSYIFLTYEHSSSAIRRMDGAYGTVYRPRLSSSFAPQRMGYHPANFSHKRRGHSRYISIAP